MKFIRYIISNSTLYGGITIAAISLLVFFAGLSSPFMGDDMDQIVNNLPVHSLSNINLFFQGGTFYAGQGLEPLTGSYYRPLMLTAFSLIYSFFGDSSLAFHLVQLLLHALSAFVLFIVFRYFFKPLVALVLAIIFLVHPMNSMSVYSIPVMQEPLFFLFGITGFWTLLRFQYKSQWYLLITVGCLALSLFSKETGFLFVLVSGLYVFIADRKRLMPYLLLAALVVGSYLLIKIHAVGLAVNPTNAPIDSLSLGGRLMTLPSIVTFYLSKFLWPANLAQAYYWTNQNFTVKTFLLPLVVILSMLAGLVYAGLTLHRRDNTREAILFWFFLAWLILGIGLHSQLIPLDMTACEAWFYFPMVGALGLMGIFYETWLCKLPKAYVVAAVTLIICLLGARTAARGGDWKDQLTISNKNLKVTNDDFVSENIVANELARQGNFEEALSHADRSFKIFPSFRSANTSGAALVGLKKYNQARSAFMYSAKHGGDDPRVYQNLAVLSALSGDYFANKQFFDDALKRYPRSGALWFYLAIVEAKAGHHEEALAALDTASQYGYSDSYYGQKIIANSPFEFTVDARPN